jgi:hypothetical protein
VYAQTQSEGIDVCNPKEALVMATRTDRFMSAAVRAAKTAKQWATVAAREADRLLKEAKKKAESHDRRRRVQRTLLKTARVLNAAGRAAVVAGAAAGIAAARAKPARDSKERKLSKGAKRAKRRA